MATATLIDPPCEALRVDDHCLEYRWFGTRPPRGPTLVFLHEALGSAPLWRDVPAALAALTGLPAMAYSRRGFGGSDPRPLPLPVDYLDIEADRELPAVLDALDIAEPILIGHSDGATIALMHAGSPAGARVRAVVAEAPHVFVEETTAAGIREALPVYRGGLREKLARHHGAQTDGVFFGWYDTWLSPEFRGWNVEDRLPAIACPTLVIQGLDDQYGTPRQVEAIAAAVTGPVETMLLPGCGHTPHRDRREEVLAAIARFVRNLPHG
ncbi:MAG: alpha/beta hydrolase [Alphaproteobacteria bacterium]|nr:alpha/beta hydrolase [Alphaproteobacteria bacterium]